MISPSRSLSEVRRVERQLRNQAIRFVLCNLLSKPIRRTGHFREWFRTPMNYARIMELPLAFMMLKTQENDRVLDVSSPKLLSLYFALNGYGSVIAADLEDYFVSDFDAFMKYAGLRIQTAVFDAAQKIPYPDSYFDKIFSVSVLEHIPGNGDSLAIREMLRVLKPSGSIVITLPAFTHYVEEWTSLECYWTTIRGNSGKAFYQRRYDHDTLLKNFAVPGSEIQEIILIAERPIKSPRIGETGMMLHNSYYLDQDPVARALKTLSRYLRVIPFIGYLAEFIVSKKCHYLTCDWTDPNIRQVVVKITKSTASEQTD